VEPLKGFFPLAAFMSQLQNAAIFGRGTQDCGVTSG
jgi:hypothetical protein